MLQVFGIDLKKKQKIKASSLSYALLIITLLGVFLSSLILLVSLYNRTYIKLEKENDLIDDAHSVVNYSLVKHSQLSNEFQELDLGLTSKVLLRKKKWGALTQIQYKVFRDTDTLKETLFVNTKKADEFSIFLANSNDHLSIGGETELEGDIKIPFGELKKLNLSYQKNILSHTGKILKSEGNLTKIECFTEPNDFIEVSELDLYEEHRNSFFNKTKRIEVNSEELENVRLSGNYIIESKRALKIKSNNYLEDVIIKAPKIIVEKGFKGVLQIIADEKMVIEESVKLGYPSVIQVANKNKTIDLEIKKNSTVLGALIGVSDKDSDKNNGVISENTLIMGDLYFEGMLDFKGEMYGTIYTNGFYVKTLEAEYKNAVIGLKVKKISKSFSKVGITGKDHKICSLIKRIK